MKMDGQRSTIYMCYVIGSISQADEILAQAAELKGRGNCIVKYVKPRNDVPLAELISECFDTILWADNIYVIKKPDGSYGDGVLYELEYAKRMGKRIIPVESSKKG